MILDEYCNIFLTQNIVSKTRSSPIFLSLLTKNEKSECPKSVSNILVIVLLRVEVRKLKFGGFE